MHPVALHGVPKLASQLPNFDVVLKFRQRFEKDFGMWYEKKCASFTCYYFPPHLTLKVSNMKELRQRIDCLIPT